MATSTKQDNEITEEDYAYLYAAHQELKKEHDIFLNKYMNLVDTHQAVIDILQGRVRLTAEEDK